MHPAVTSDHPFSAAIGAGRTVVARLQDSALFRAYRQAFETTTGLPLVLRAAGSFRTPLQGSARANPFCGFMIRANQTCAACLQLQQRLEEEATLAPKTLRCYAGLSESTVPVRVGDTVIGYLQTGQVFLGAPSEKRFREISGAMPGAADGADRRELRSAYFGTRVVNRRQYESILRLLAIFAEHLGVVSNQIMLREAAAEAPLVAKVRDYVTAHQGEVLCLNLVARAMNISSFYFCKRFKEASGLTFTAFVARARVEGVKERLLDVHVRVSEAAFAAGFQSLSQFNRVFQRVAGETPSRYRDRLHGLKRDELRSAGLGPAA